MLLSKDQILAARPLPVEEVEVPEWGGSVRIQGLSAGDADHFNASLQRRNGQVIEMDREFYCAKLLALCFVDANNQRVLTEAHVLSLSQQSAMPLTRLTLIAERLSGMRVDGVEQAAKNSASGQPGSSSSGSPPNLAS
jgi:hypothetical protein